MERGSLSGRIFRPSIAPPRKTALSLGTVRCLQHRVDFSDKRPLSYRRITGKSEIPIRRVFTVVADGLTEVCGSDEDHEPLRAFVSTEPVNAAPCNSRTILFLGHCYRDGLGFIRPTREWSQVRRALRDSEYLPQDEWDVPLYAIGPKLKEYTPTVLHIAGHGTAETGPLFVNDNGEAMIADWTAFVNALIRSGVSPGCIVLNTCHSNRRAYDLLDVTERVICYDGLLRDEAAIFFSERFYTYLVQFNDPEKSFSAAQDDMRLHEMWREFADKYRLLKRNEDRV